MLRGVLIDESQSTEPLKPGSETIDSSSGDKPVVLPRRFQNYELIIGEDGKPVEKTVALPIAWKLTNK